MDAADDLPSDVDSLTEELSEDAPSSPSTWVSETQPAPTGRQRGGQRHNCGAGQARKAVKAKHRNNGPVKKNVVFLERPLVAGQCRRTLLDIFSGKGGLARAARRHGWHVREVDILHGPAHDLTENKLQQELMQQVRARNFSWVHMGPPCTTFSSWYRFTSKQCTRSRSQPRGLNVSPAERLGNQMADFSASLARLCLEVGVWFTIEQPRTSLMWQLDNFRSLHAHPSVDCSNLVMCKYGSEHEKKTTFMTNAGWAMKTACKCENTRRVKTHRHVRLEGSARDPITGLMVHKTALAAAYPDPLCNRLLRLADDAIHSHVND